MHRLECSFAHMWFEEKVTEGLVDKQSFSWMRLYSENENVSVCIFQKGDSLCQRPVISKANSLSITFSSVQSLSRVRLFVTPWITAGQAPLSITNSPRLTKLMSLSQWCHPTISFSFVPFSSSMLLSYVRLFVTPCTVACQASLSITTSHNLLRLRELVMPTMSIESVMPSKLLILCHPLLLLRWIFPSIRVFSYESVLLIKWPKYQSF